MLRIFSLFRRNRHSDNYILRYGLKGLSAETLFTRIFQIHREKRERGDMESVSGVGSYLDQTEVLVRELPILIRTYLKIEMMTFPVVWYAHAKVPRRSIGKDSETLSRGEYFRDLSRPQTDSRPPRFGSGIVDSHDRRPVAHVAAGVSEL